MNGTSVCMNVRERLFRSLLRRYWNIYAVVVNVIFYGPLYNGLRFIPSFFDKKRATKFECGWTQKKCDNKSKRNAATNLNYDLVVRSTIRLFL
jgi:hypothetical protein